MTNEDTTKNNNTKNNNEEKIIKKQKDVLTPEKNPHSPLCRCVSICNTDINSDKSLLIGSTSSSKMRIQQPHHVNESFESTMNRKRPRPNSFDDPSAEKHPNALSHKPRAPNNVDTKDMNKTNSYTTQLTMNSCAPSQLIPKMPLSCQSELVLLNKNNLPKQPPCTPFTPASPVRSVVSCDDGAQIMKELTAIGDVGVIPAVLAANDNQDSHIPDVITSTDYSSLPQNLQLHVNALRIEASLGAMKQLLARLMSHLAHNRKGTFNEPVDYKAFGLVDYLTVVKHPMDLGTVKKTLYSNSYLSHEHAADDIRLVFRNAMLYNPPSHPVHEAANHLLEYFESNYTTIANSNSDRKVTTTTVEVKGLSSETSISNIMPVSRTDFSVPMHHTCQACQGRTCRICNQQCLGLESTLVICNGAQCAGSKIRRGVQYYCSPDGTKAWCLRCYAILPSILLMKDESDGYSQAIQYKRDLLKRRNDEDIVERWLTCRKCGEGVHEICGYVNEFCNDTSEYECQLCSESILPLDFMNTSRTERSIFPSCYGTYSFLSGERNPRKIKHAFDGTSLDCRTLPTCAISEFIESKVRERMIELKCSTHAEETVSVRVISDCEKTFQVPDVVRNHFRMKGPSHDATKMSGTRQYDEPPSEIPYQSKAIALFQRIDGMDVCIFCMYVQEYDEIQSQNDSSNPVQSKRVYIAYLDSVEHFRPRALRTNVYHEILVAYFATARAREYKHAHIWSCPPSRGNSFVFWTHPTLQRTPTKERLLSWYHQSLSYALQRGVVTDVKSLYEFSFQEYDKDSQEETNFAKKNSPILVCPPLLEGDFWIEEALRLQSSSMERFSRCKRAPESGTINDVFCPEELFGDNRSSCPVIQVATLLQDYISVHPSAVPFCRPVNATALKLLDYHDIIKKPMDLGTIISQCYLGEYREFSEIVADTELVFTNAMLFNPKGHIVHTMASDLLQYTKEQLEILVAYWSKIGIGQTSGEESVEDFADLSMRLGTFIPVSKNDVDMSSSSKSCQTSNKLEYKGDSASIVRRMVGNDIWLLDKKNGFKPPKCNKTQNKKKGKGKGKGKSIHFDECSKRKESWLGDAVLNTVRRMRTDFFVCDLFETDMKSPCAKGRQEAFDSYIASFDTSLYNSASSCRDSRYHTKPGVAEARHGLLEFSQYRNFQFDTVRRAKYSTAMMLFHLQHEDSVGVIPTCTYCQNDIVDVRWRKLNKAFDERRRSSQTMSIRMTSVEMKRVDLCSPCYDKETLQESYIPVRVSFKRVEV